MEMLDFNVLVELCLSFFVIFLCNYIKLLFSSVASPFGEVENVEVQKRKYENESTKRKYGSDSQTLPVWAGHPAHTGKVLEACPYLALSWITRLAMG